MKKQITTPSKIKLANAPDAFLRLLDKGYVIARQGYDIAEGINSTHGKKGEAQEAFKAAVLKGQKANIRRSAVLVELLYTKTGKVSAVDFSYDSPEAKATYTTSLDDALKVFKAYSQTMFAVSAERAFLKASKAA